MGFWCGREKGNKQVKDEKKDGGTEPEEDGDQPFSFTVGDPGSLLGGITCKTTNGRQVK